MDGLKATSKTLRLMAVFLAIGTVVLTMASVYVAGVEQGVNSQHPEIAELYRRLNPDVLINWLPYMHPLRNFLLGSAVFTGIWWAVLFIATCLQAKARSRGNPRPEERNGQNTCLSG